MADRRPSFTDFWKHQQQSGKKFVFVSSKLGQQPSPHSSSSSPSHEDNEKARARRQQVRRAQLQHRQRKANYTKQLEADVTKLRDDIAAVELEVQRLRMVNGDLRASLLVQEQTQQLDSGVMADPSEFVMETELPPAYEVSLEGFGDEMSYPVYQGRPVSSSSASLQNSPPAQGMPIETYGLGSDPAMMGDLCFPEQTTRAVDYMLAYDYPDLCAADMGAYFPM